MLNFQFFKAIGSTYSRLHQRLPKPFKAAAISSRHVLKLMRDGNLYLGPLQIIARIIESEMIFTFPIKHDQLQDKSIWIPYNLMNQGCLHLY